MIVLIGGYRLDLYCDAPGCIEQKHVSSADSERAALKIARRRGWVVNTKTKFVRCPAHKHYRPYATNAQARGRKGLTPRLRDDRPDSSRGNEEA